MSLLAIIGFALAGYSVIANDSVQTLGTWIASNREKFKWYTMWAAASAVMIGTLVYGWNVYDGDISFGRLTKIPFKEVQWYHALAPLALVALTRKGNLKQIFPIVAKDFLKLLVGLVVSVVIVLLIHYVL